MAGPFGCLGGLTSPLPRLMHAGAPASRPSTAGAPLGSRRDRSTGQGAARQADGPPNRLPIAPMARAAHRHHRSAAAPQPRRKGRVHTQACNGHPRPRHGAPCAFCGAPRQPAGLGHSIKTKRNAAPPPERKGPAVSDWPFCFLEYVLPRVRSRPGRSQHR